MRIVVVLLSLLPVFILSSCRESRLKEHTEWGARFTQHGIKDGCFILRDNNHESIHFYNKQRCLTRYSPASTFKIFNSMVGLETAVAPDQRLFIKWDSVDRGRTECNQGMDMATAFKESCAWYYQELARRVGAAKMQHYLDTVKYGNMNMGGTADQFWLNDSLKISADEQAGFIKRLYFAELPVSERSQRIVKDMMLHEDDPGFKLYYKTGTICRGGKCIYWVTGFVERIIKVKEPKGSMNKMDFRMYPYFFSMNFDAPEGDRTHDWFAERIALMKEVLKDYEALPK